MSQSQASFYSESFIDPDLLQSDDPPDRPSSQLTQTSIPASDFTYPLRHSRAPDSLTRVGPTLRRFWILYNSDAEMENSQIQFVKWWLKTEFSSKKETQDTIHWDGKKKSDLWESFEQVAHEKTGEPKPRVSTSKVFSQDILLKKLLKFVTTARLPFRIVEHPEFKDLVEIIQLAQSKIDIPSARSLRRYLDTTVQEQQQSVLSKLLEGSRLSIALDCWTSPFSQAFMAITGYFLDQEWNYREVLLGFEHLHGSHTGGNLSETVFQILQEHGIADRVLSVHEFVNQIGARRRRRFML
ncbi:hypothetical protein N7486_011152 [Penicillium sp. IBT 16267x]|nr:hypothetical protein N7486_011152 [Penicillium sp. IBT 16267x]